MTIEFCIFELFWEPNFSLIWQSSFFKQNFSKKSISGLKRKNKHDHWILHIRISLGTYTDNFDLLDQICSKRAFPVKKETIEYHHWILHIRISLGT